MRCVHPAVVPLLLLASCATDTGESATFVDPCAAGLKSQVMSEPCCPGLGLDACGAGLFCAAFDGRLQPTCYAEYSRKDGADCSEDRQCGSASCNTDVQKCRYVYGVACAADVGCAPTAAGAATVCASEDAGKFVCEKPGTTKVTNGYACLSNEACASGYCDSATSVCKGALNDKCSSDMGCQSGTCAPYGACSQG